MIRVGGAAIACLFVAILAIFFSRQGSGQEQEVLELRIQAGEPLWDTMERSTLRNDVRIALDMQDLPLSSMYGWNGDRFQVAIGAGDGRFATIPWTPSGGKLWMSVGVIDGIDLDFLNFPSTRANSPGWMRPEDSFEYGAGTPDQEIEAIVQIYEAIQSLHPKPAERVNCYHNSLTETPSTCDRVTMATSRLSPDELRTALRDHLRLVTAESEDGIAPDGKYALTLNLGQWWLPNGNLAMIVVMPNPNFISGNEDPDRAWGLKLSLNIKEFFGVYLSRLIPTCYDQQALFPDRVLYTQQEAAHIFHGLFDYFYPPTLDGRVITDPVELQLLDWTELSDRYQSDPETRRGFCARLRQLEIEAGYAGPFAPYR